MRGELKDIDRNIFNYSVARGLFFDGNEAYMIEVYAGGNTEELGIKMTDSGGQSYTEVVLNQPDINGAGMNESLSMTDERAQLPETGEELEALARYVLQEGPDQGLEYEGPRELGDLEY